MSNIKQTAGSSENNAQAKPALNPIAYPYGNNIDADMSTTKIPFLNATEVLQAKKTYLNGGDNEANLIEKYGSPDSGIASNVNFTKPVGTHYNEMVLETTQVPFRPGDWTCNKCQYHNFNKNTTCLRCKDVKVENEDSPLNGRD